MVFLGIGRFMASEDPLQPADAIVVLGGTRAERPLEAADLYLEKYAPIVVLSQGNLEDHALNEARRRGARITTDFELQKRMLIDVGVPDEAVITTPSTHDNTAEEARSMAALSSQKGWRRLIVVSSKYHLRRAALAFHRAFRGTGIDVRMRGSRYDRSTPARWWSRRGDVRWLASEVPKLIAYACGFGG